MFNLLSSSPPVHKAGMKFILNSPMGFAKVSESMKFPITTPVQSLRSLLPLHTHAVHTHVHTSTHGNRETMKKADTNLNVG